MKFLDRFTKFGTKEKPREYIKLIEDERVRRALKSNTTRIVGDIFKNNIELSNEVVGSLLQYVRTDVETRKQLVPLVNVVVENDSKVLIVDEAKPSWKANIGGFLGEEQRVSVERSLAEEAVRYGLVNRIAEDIEELTQSAFKAGIISEHPISHFDIQTRSVNPKLKEERIPRSPLEPEIAKMAEFWGQIGIFFQTPNESILEHYGRVATSYVRCSDEENVRLATLRLTEQTLKAERELKSLLKHN